MNVEQQGISTLLRDLQSENARRRENQSALDRARTLQFVDWAGTSGFIADRERIDFRLWRYLRPIYELVPLTLKQAKGLTITIMKPSQAGATIFALLLLIRMMLMGRLQFGYYLPVQKTALEFSSNRFLPLVRDNDPIHRLMGDPDSPIARKVIAEGSASVRRLHWSIAYFMWVQGTISTESFPLDGLFFDEVQEMPLPEMERADERLSASDLMMRIRVSTANFEGGDIDRYYKMSDQREFFTNCRCATGINLADAWSPSDGPLCIGQGNGTTPGVPTEPFYFCPRCSKIITDTQDGEFVAQAPEVKHHKGLHWSQMLSPKQTAASILTKWDEKIDTKNFFNRILGKPYTDPNTQPVNLQHLLDSENKDLRWGPPSTAQDYDGVYMGIDQMGNDNRVVIVAKPLGSSRMRLLHLEVIQAADPFARCYELMKLYKVRIAAIEANPNFNQAHMFAAAHPGRVFVVNYNDLKNELIAWGDRPKDPATMRKTDEDARVRWAASVDQYKMMGYALAKWSRGEVETPNAKTLIQNVKTPKGLQPVMVLGDMFYRHIQHVALVTKLVEGHEAERKLRRSVVKVGAEDPHFAYAWMCVCVAWVRAYGTEQMLIDETPNDRRVGVEKSSAYTEQIKERLPAGFFEPPVRAETLVLNKPSEAELTCNDCVSYDPEALRCKLRNLGNVKPAMPACDLFTDEIEEGDY